MLRKLIFPLFISGFFVFYCQPAKASHAAGADLTYQCLGNDKYKVTLRFYRDCKSSATPDLNTPSVSMNYSSSCGSGTKFLTLSKAAGSGQEVSPTCPSAKTTCQGGTLNGIRELIYEGTLDLSTETVCSDWTLSYSVSSRNAAITTVQNASSANLYVETHLNNKDVTCNSSPAFSNKPATFICTGQSFCYNHGASDIDGDSLAYKLITPKTSATGVVTYYAGYSPTQPLLSTPPLSIDSATGDICMTPTKVEVTIMAVLVEEYRNGQKIGSVMRDMQIHTMTCTNNVPSLDGMNATMDYDTSICMGSLLCFDTHSFDADTTQNLTMTWNQGIPDAAFTISSGSRPTGSFCWTPKASDVSTIPHCFTVQIKDNNCPVNGLQTYSFCITVGSPAVDLGPDTSICVGPLTLDPGSGSGYDYDWSTGDTTETISVSSSGVYTITVTNSTLGCSVTDSIDVTIGSIKINLGPDRYICSNDSVVLDAGYPGLGYNYNWNTGETSQKITVKSTGSYTVVVDNGAGCSGTDSADVFVTTKPTLTTSNDTVLCPGQSVSLFALGGASYLWTPSTYLDDSSSATPTSSPAQTVTYTVYAFSGPSQSGCTDTAQVIVNTDSIFAEAIIPFTSKVVCKYDSITIGGNPTGPVGAKYLWTPSVTLSCDTCANPSAQPTITTKYTVTVTKGLCTAQDTVTIQVDSVKAVAGTPANICLYQCTPLNASGGTNYSWQPTTGLSNSFSATPNACPPYNITYVVTVIGSSGCTDTESVRINVDTNLIKPVTLRSDTTICPYNQIPLTAMHYNTLAVNYLWNTGDYNQSIGAGPGIYYVTISNNCFSSSDTVNVFAKDCHIEVPNVFSPVGDGINDYFFIKGLDPHPGSRLIIFNRWGVKVYQSEDYKNDWDGRHWKSLNRLSEGVYYYILEVPHEDARSGFVTLLRGYKF